MEGASHNCSVSASTVRIQPALGKCLGLHLEASPGEVGGHPAGADWQDESARPSWGGLGVGIGQLMFGC